MTDKVLGDIRVLDFGRFIACPYCGMMMSDMGAEVIRVERTGGEEDRTFGLLADNGQNMTFPAIGRNKKAITLNLRKNEKSRAVFRDLVKKSDVVIHSFTADAAKMMGLTYEELSAVNPKIILAAVSCYGSEGPYANRPGFDFIAQAMSGHFYCGGYPDKPPMRAFMAPMDFGTGLAAAFGVMSALRHRDRTGEGQMVDLSLLRTALSLAAPHIAEAEVLGIPKPFVGNRGPYMGPTDMYQCKDGILEDAHLPCSPVKKLDEVTDDPHIQATGMVKYMDFEEPGLEKVPVSGTPLTLSKTPPKIERRPPKVGEHNHEIYSGLLGYSKEYLNELIKEGIV